MVNKTYLTSATSTASARHGEPLKEAVFPKVSIPQATTVVHNVGVYVQGRFVQSGTTELSGVHVALDPAAIERKVAVQRFNSELNGALTTTTNKRFR